MRGFSSTLLQVDESGIDLPDVSVELTSFEPRRTSPDRSARLVLRSWGWRVQDRARVKLFSARSLKKETRTFPGSGVTGSGTAASIIRRPTATMIQVCGVRVWLLSSQDEIRKMNTSLFPLLLILCGSTDVWRPRAGRPLAAVAKIGLLTRNEECDRGMNGSAWERPDKAIR